MTQKNINTQKDENPILSQVLGILGMKENPFKNIDGDYKMQINSIIKSNSKVKGNKKLALYLIEEVDVSYFYSFPELHTDKKIVLAALKQDSNVFARLDIKLKSQLDIAMEAIKSLVREKVNFIEVEKFLSKHFPEAGMFTKMFQFYKKYLTVAEYFFNSDIEKQLITLREKYPKIYNLLFEKKLFEQRGKTIHITQKFSEYFLEQVDFLGDIHQLSPEEKKQKYVFILQTYLAISNADMSEDIQMFFESVLDLIHIKRQKNKKVDEDDEEIKNTSDLEYEDEEEEIEDRLEFCVPQCRYCVSSDGGCDLQVGHNVHMYLSQDEIGKMNDRALKNYVSGITRLTELGLGFIIKHQNQFFRSICGIDPFAGEGLSEAKLLKILNKIGKKIGIPERNFTEKKDEDGNEQREIGCFNRFEEAVYQFRQIASSGKINDTLICDVSQKGNRSIIEIALIQKGYFDAQGKGFNVGKW